MPNQPGFREQPPLLRRRINRELDVIETRFSSDFLQLTSLLSGAEQSEGRSKAELEAAARKHSKAMILELLKTVFAIRGITAEEAQAAVEQIKERTFARWNAYSSDPTC